MKVKRAIVKLASGLIEINVWWNLVESGTGPARETQGWAGLPSPRRAMTDLYYLDHAKTGLAKVSISSTFQNVEEIATLKLILKKLAKSYEKFAICFIFEYLAFLKLLMAKFSVYPFFDLATLSIIKYFKKKSYQPHVVGEVKDRLHRPHLAGP